MAKNECKEFIGMLHNTAMNIADIAIHTYLAESALLRVQQLIDKQGEEASEVQIAIVKTYFYDIADKINKIGNSSFLTFI